MSDSEDLGPFTFSEEMENWVSLSMLTNDDKSFEAEDALIISRGYRDMLKIEKARRDDKADEFLCSSQPTSPNPHFFQSQFIWTNQHIIALLDYYENNIDQVEDFTSNSLNFPDILKGISDDQCKEKLREMKLIFRKMSIRKEEDGLDRFRDKKILEIDRKEMKKLYRGLGKRREEELEDEEEEKEDNDEKELKIFNGNLLLVTNLDFKLTDSELQDAIIKDVNLKLGDFSVKIVKNATDESIGSARVVCKDKKIAELILEKFPGVFPF